ncbi:MAG: PHP domain-containing protein [Clostridia bacterium]|nr:PHP domain-containing protein [Clostridia bacterium]
MSKYFCDLHIHSCLSPCADNDMTPANIAGMAMINGLGIVAVTDHNTCKNCPAFFAHAKKFGIVPVAGMELTTSEDVHVVCLFRNLSDAMEFDSYVESKRAKIKNKPDIFGHQYLMDEADDIIGEEEYLLINAVDISIDEAYREVLSRGGVCYPAHIDRISNGIISMLGDFPPEPNFTCFELRDSEKYPELCQKHPVLCDLVKTKASDAHSLTSISEADFSIEIDDEDYSSDKVRNSLIDILLSKHKEKS